MRRRLVPALALAWALVGPLAPMRAFAMPIESVHRSIYAAKPFDAECVSTTALIAATDRQGRAFLSL